MSRTARASFDITGWDEDVVIDEDGARVVRTRITKRFTGDVEGTSVGEMVMAHAQEGSAAYVGFERITATVEGRSGSFVLQHVASGTPDGGSAAWTVVERSGVGGLAGISGTGEIVRHDDGTHTFTLVHDP